MMVISGKFIAGGLALAAISAAVVVGGVKGANFVDDNDSKSIIAGKVKTDVDGDLNLRVKTEEGVDSEGNRYTRNSFEYDGEENTRTNSFLIFKRDR